MTSTTTITTLNGVLTEATFETSDELMLEELERRDGIYSFIFHELEAPKVTKAAESDIMQSHTPIRSGRRNSFSSKGSLKKVELSQQFDSLTATKSTATAPASASTSPPASAPAPAPAQASASALTVTTSTKSLSSLTNGAGEAVNGTPNSTSILSSTANKSFTKLSTQNELFRYQQYLKTWYPPPPTPPAVSSRQMNFMKASPATMGGSSMPFYLNKRQTNLYVCMMNCGVSVRPQPPRFSHITEPLVRNRRHVLKDSEEYKQGSNLHSPQAQAQAHAHAQAQAPDLRALFPYDPDVHAPFLTASRNGALGCLKVESDMKSDENKLLATCSE